jgi:hypothetical protein
MLGMNVGFGSDDDRTDKVVVGIIEQRLEVSHTADAEKSEHAAQHNHDGITREQFAPYPHVSIPAHDDCPPALLMTTR